MMKSKENSLKISAAFNWVNRLFSTGRETSHPFWLIVEKEISDHVRSLRFVIMVALIGLTSAATVYLAMSGLKDAIKPSDPEGSFLFLKLFTVSDGAIPSFHIFIGFLGPLLGISMAFDSINSELGKGTMSRLLAQPIHRDYIINAKFVAAIIVITGLFLCLSLLVTGWGILKIGILPTFSEFCRILALTALNVLYVSFWLNLSIYFSIRFKQPSTSALACIAVWLFVTVFYGMLVSLIARSIAPSEFAMPNQIIAYQKFVQGLGRLVPSQLFSDACTTLLMPSVRSLGPLTLEQLHGAIPSPLGLGQSLLVVWPQLTGLTAATVVCFALSYRSFMRKEIRSR